MPELPEVETVRRGLRPVMEGRSFGKVEQRRANLRFALPSGFARRLTGRAVVALTRRAKYLLAHLEDGQVLLMHLGMTGRFAIGEDAAAPAPVHEHVVFHMRQGARIGYRDPRRFGVMDLIAGADLAEYPPLAALGPEPLSEAFDAAALQAALAGRRTTIKAALLDQRMVAGLGNIYVCEALFRAGMRPTRETAEVARERGADGGLARLAEATKAVLREAIASGGSSLRDFAGADGALGYFQTRFEVYGREGERCLRFGCEGMVERIVQQGRSSFFCPVCQR
jgi:formamidopyrimidine-DNA glycosylase